MENNHNLKEDFKNLGFIARMNRLQRVPAHDPKAIDLLKTRNNLKASVLLAEWLIGWDSCNLEESRYTRKPLL